MGTFVPAPSSANPLVSIITPTYNHEKFIRACIESVLCQTYQNWEQVIIDDGSTDGTAEIVREYRDPRIRYYYQDNAGIEALAHTYNRALSLSRGELTAILEGDDFWPAEKLCRMIPAFEDASVVLAYGEMREAEIDGRLAKRMTRNARIRTRLPAGILHNDPPPAAVAYMLTARGHSMIPASTVIVRHSALQVIGGFQYVPELRYLDFPTFMRLAALGKFHYCRQVVGYRRMHAGSATSQYTKEMLRASQKFRRQLIDDPQYALTDRDRRSIEESWRSIESATEYNLGRLCLFDRQWAPSRTHFFRALRTKDWCIFLGSAAGLLLSWLHCDLERLYRVTGRASLKAHS